MATSENAHAIALDTASLPTLYVDLDGTLIQTDLLLECAIGLVKRDTSALCAIPGWLIQGRPTLKRRLAEEALPDPADLPYRPEVISYLSEQHRLGRKLILATAADRNAADKVASYLGFFDGVLATHNGINLKGRAKLKAIQQHSGKDAFAYLGDSNADKLIWAKASECLMAGASRRLNQYVAQQSKKCIVIAEHHPVPSALFVAMRPRQWVKNSLLIAPMLAAHELQTGYMLQVFLGIACFCLAASSIYLVNDILDVHSDRTHPIKSRRPIASGQLSIGHAAMAVPVLMGITILIAAMFLPLAFLGWLTVYLVLTTLYSIHLRSRPLIDVITLAGLYALRIFAGGAVVDIAPSFWLITLSIFLFLSLGFLKRYAELNNMSGTIKASPDKPPRRSDRSYVIEDCELIRVMGIVSGYAAAVILCLYLNDPSSQHLYSKPTILWPIVPLFLFWVSRIWLIAQRGRMNEDPVAWAVGDRLSWVLAMVVLLLAMLASG